MSGGTDSSVAALLLQDAGYDVTGVTFRFYETDGSTEYLDDARELCRRLGIEHIISDQRELFGMPFSSISPEYQNASLRSFV